jgi:hypothetical protein
MKGIGNTAGTDTRREGSLVALEDVFVSIDLDGDVAYVAYEDESAIRWEEVARADGELLVRMGARSSNNGAIVVSRRATSIAEGGCP